MKMVEFLQLTDDEKVAIMPDDCDYEKLTDDKGLCFYCGKDVTADCFCFGCHLLVCMDCVESEKHACT